MGTPIRITGLAGRAYLLRGAWLWLAVRIGLGALLMLFSASPVRLAASISFAVIAAVSMVSYVYLQRRHEVNLLHNLGMPVLVIVAISALPAIVAESAIDIVQSLAR
ncbi:MAG TPA: hypothetical protein VM053_02945 [Gemmatimonadaceae bacterium]|nr:hypothetical protein [Gemmatimonadaceae bacterium]